MDPHYMESYEFDTLSISPLHTKIKVRPNLLRLVSLLGLDKS